MAGVHHFVDVSRIRVIDKIESAVDRAKYRVSKTGRMSERWGIRRKELLNQAVTDRRVLASLCATGVVHDALLLLFMQCIIPV
jgi:hypothetical protein